MQIKKILYMQINNENARRSEQGEVSEAAKSDTAKQKKKQQQLYQQYNKKHQGRTDQQLQQYY